MSYFRNIVENVHQNQHEVINILSWDEIAFFSEKNLSKILKLAIIIAPYVHSVVASLRCFIMACDQTAHRPLPEGELMESFHFKEHSQWLLFSSFVSVRALQATVMDCWLHISSALRLSLKAGLWEDA